MPSFFPAKNQVVCTGVLPLLDNLRTVFAAFGQILLPWRRLTLSPNRIKRSVIRFSRWVFLVEDRCHRPFYLTFLTVKRLLWCLWLDILLAVSGNLCSNLGVLTPVSSTWIICLHFQHLIRPSLATLNFVETSPTPTSYLRGTCDVAHR